MPWRADFSWVWFMELFAIPAYLSGCQNQGINSQAGLSTPVCGPITPLPAPFLVPFQSWDFIATDIGTLNLSFLICEVGVKESYLGELKVLEDKKETIIPTFEGHNGLVKSEDNPCSNLTGEEMGFWKMVSFSWQETESAYRCRTACQKSAFSLNRFPFFYWNTDWGQKYWKHWGSTDLHFIKVKGFLKNTVMAYNPIQHKYSYQLNDCHKKTL